MSINSQYRTNERIKNSITKVKKLFNKKPAVWIDHLNNKIGFTAQQFSMIFGKDEIKNITIQNLLPAKGPGGSYLRVLLANNNELEIFNGDVRAFNPFIEQLKTLTAKEIVMKPEYPDE